jgi:hypothetical protein
MHVSVKYLCGPRRGEARPRVVDGGTRDYGCNGRIIGGWLRVPANGRTRPGWVLRAATGRV